MVVIVNTLSVHFFRAAPPQQIYFRYNAATEIEVLSIHTKFVNRTPSNNPNDDICP